MLPHPQHPDRLVDQEIGRRHAQRRIMPELRLHPVGMIEAGKGAALFRKRCGRVGVVDRQFRGDIGKRGLFEVVGIASGSGSG